MPEFILEGRDHAARAESDFVLGFIEAMFFTNCADGYYSWQWFLDECRADVEAGEAGGTVPCDVGYTDLHTDSLAAIRADCEAWQKANAKLLKRAYARGYDETQAGRDYWFTRNGHGVGFWDRPELKSHGLGDALSDACRYNEVHVWFGDHVTYGNAPFVYVSF